MDKEIIERELKDRLSNFVNTYPYVTFNFGYDNSRDCILVTYSISNSNSPGEFWSDLLNIEEYFTAAYGEEAPLFCENESLFKTPSESEIICTHDVKDKEAGRMTSKRNRRTTYHSTASHAVPHI